jgi:hypothetical protein
MTRALHCRASVPRATGALVCVLGPHGALRQLGNTSGRICHRDYGEVHHSQGRSIDAHWRPEVPRCVRACTQHDNCRSETCLCHSCEHFNAAQSNWAPSDSFAPALFSEFGQDCWSDRAVTCGKVHEPNRLHGLLPREERPRLPSGAVSVFADGENRAQRFGSARGWPAIAVDCPAESQKNTPPGSKYSVLAAFCFKPGPAIPGTEVLAMTVPTQSAAAETVMEAAPAWGEGAPGPLAPLGWGRNGN